jgi:hypothetical protein
MDDHSAGTMMSVEERKTFRRATAMKGLIGLMMAHEDKFGRAMTYWELVNTARFPDLDVDILLFEMLEMSYVSRASIERTSCKDLLAAIQKQSWGTTFFGRDWYKCEQRRLRGEMLASSSPINHDFETKQAGP